MVIDQAIDDISGLGIGLSINLSPDSVEALFATTHANLSYQKI